MTRDGSALRGLSNRTDESVVKNLTQLRVQARAEALLGSTRDAAPEHGDSSDAGSGGSARPGGRIDRSQTDRIGSPDAGSSRLAGIGTGTGSPEAEASRAAGKVARTSASGSRASAAARVAGKVGSAANTVGSAGSRTTSAARATERVTNTESDDPIDAGHDAIGHVTTRTGQTVADRSAKAAGKAAERTGKAAYKGGSYLAGKAGASLTAARDSRAALRTQKTSKAVRGGLVAQQRRKAAAKAGKTAAAKTGQSISTALPRAGATVSRAASAVAAAVRVVVSAIVGAFSGTPVLLITVTVIAVLMALIAAIGWLIPGVHEEQQQEQQQIDGAALKPGSVPAQYVQWINQAGSLCTAITAPLIAAHIYAESTFKDHPANSSGAAGPAQFTAATWKTWGIDADGNGTKNLHSVPDAVVAMGRMDCGMVKSLSSKFPDADPVGLALAAYLNGPAAVIAAHGVPSDNATQAYIQKIQSLATSKFTDPAGGGAVCGGGDWVTPVPKGWVVGSTFHQVGPHWSWMGWHTGYDFTIAQGTPVYAAAAGTVREVNHFGSNPNGEAWGNQIIIDHGKMNTANGQRYISTTYNHLSVLSAHVGQKVKAGQQIGKVGQTGNVTGPHLHFEVHDPATPSFNWANPAPTDFLDPWKWLQDHRSGNSAADSISGDSGCGGSGDVPAGSSVAAKAVAAAKAELGTPYSFGGGTPQKPTMGMTAPAGWDCSSYMQMAYYRASKGKINLPRLTYDQIDSPLVKSVPLDKVQPGDLIFVKTDAATWSHVTMYVGGGKIIEEPRTGLSSRIAPLSEYSNMVKAARRVTS